MAEFRPRPFGKWWIRFFFVIFAGAAVALLVVTFRGSGERPPVIFTMFWLFAFGWNAYWWLFRAAVALRLHQGVLFWEGPLRSGQIPLANLIAVRPMRLLSQVEVFERSDGRPVLVMATKGLQRFLDELAAAKPELPVQLGWQGRLAERMPGWSGWRDQA